MRLDTRDERLAVALSAIRDRGSLHAGVEGKGSYSSYWLVLKEAQERYGAPLYASNARRRMGSRLTPEGEDVLEAIESAMRDLEGRTRDLDASIAARKGGDAS